MVVLKIELFAIEVLPDDVVVVLVEGGVGGDHAQAQLHADEDELGRFQPDPGLGDVRPVRSQEGQDALGSTRSHAPADGQCHEQAVAKGHQKQRDLKIFQKRQIKLRSAIVSC